MTKIAADLQKKLKSARHLKGSGRDWEFYKEQERLRRERELAHADFDIEKLKALNDKIESDEDDFMDDY
jgi:hypothetical protein